MAVRMPAMIINVPGVDSQAKLKVIDDSGLPAVLRMSRPGQWNGYVHGFFASASLIGPGHIHSIGRAWTSSTPRDVQARPMEWICPRLLRQRILDRTDVGKGEDGDDDEVRRVRARHLSAAVPYDPAP